MFRSEKAHRSTRGGKKVVGLRRAQANGCNGTARAEDPAKSRLYGYTKLDLHPINP